MIAGKIDKVEPIPLIYVGNTLQKYGGSFWTVSELRFKNQE